MTNQKISHFLWQLLSRVLYLTGLTLVLWIPTNGIMLSLKQERMMNQLAEALIQNPAFAAQTESAIAAQNADPDLPLDPFSGVGDQAVFDDTVGYVHIPKLNEHFALFIGASDAHLGQGVAQISGTDLPLSGQGTHTVIAGHRGWYGENFFAYLDHLVPGDLIQVVYLGKERCYVVRGAELIEPYEVNRLLEKPVEEEWLTLLTCHPLFYSWQRLLVHARAMTPEEEALLLRGKTSFEDLNPLPVNWQEAARAKQELDMGTYQTTLSGVLFFFQPYQYFLYWVMLGAGTISWLYTLFRILAQLFQAIKWKLNRSTGGKNA